MIKKKYILFSVCLLFFVFFVFFLLKVETYIDFLDNENSDGPGVTKRSDPIVAMSPQIARDVASESVVLFEQNGWRLDRDFPSGYLNILYRENIDDDFKELSISTDWRKHSYPLFVTTGDDGSLYVAIYDVVKNTPSGRSILVVKNGVDVYRFSGAREGMPELIAEGLQLGGIDTQLYGQFNNGYLNICGGNSCYALAVDGTSSSWLLEALKNYEFVEVAFGKAEAAAILRRVHDDRAEGELSLEFSQYYLAKFDASGVKSVEGLGDKVPYRLTFADNQPLYIAAETRDDFRDLLYYDINRLGLNGIHEYGANNLEGRVAWRQVYYLNGFISLFREELKWLLPNNIDVFRTRVLEEFELVSRMCLIDYPGLRVKRYSLDREPLVFALHLGRLLDLIDRASAIVSSERMSMCFSSLKDQLLSLDGTVETSAPVATDRGNYVLSLKYKRGFPFWADGANVPYNYISGVATGLLLFGPVGQSLAKEYMSLIHQNEFFGEMPKIWRYWSGLGDAGWNRDAKVSLNTPEYSGNKGAYAHISYRTMDAMALLKVEEVNKGFLDEGLLTHFKELTAKGWLLPHMNEIYSERDHPIVLERSVAQRHARSAASAEIQSQVWALHALNQP